MFGSVNPTPFDLRFHLFGIPVYVHPTFWVVAALLGWRQHQLDLVAIWVICVFISVLIHELGHALFQRRWGSGNYIQLHYCGGVAVFFPDAGYTPKRAIIVSLAGPAAGFLLAAVVWGINEAFAYYLLNYASLETNMAIRTSKWIHYYDYTVARLLWINIYWGVINLMPILPLDGGHVSMNLCKIFARYKGEALAYKIGMVTAILLLLWINRNAVLDMMENRMQIDLAWIPRSNYRGMFLSIMIAVLGYQNWQAYNQLTGRNF